MGGCMSRRKISRPVKILIGMGAGIAIGMLCSLLPESGILIRVFEIGGNLFLNLFKMIVVPVVLVSMILGVVSMNNPELLGRIGGKTLF